jgi:hypothetical protein
VTARLTVRLIILIVAVALGASAWAYWASWGISSVKQPIEFPHKIHIEQKIPCTGCHQGAEKDLIAGRPPAALCLACHASADSKSAEITKLKAFGEKGQEIPLPRHVFFSHRVHVAVAKLDCQSCHGPMETLDRPPARPLKTLKMDDCIGCHTKSKSTAARKLNVAHPSDVPMQRFVNDCNVCHR